VACGLHEFQLGPGEMVIGRDAACDVDEIRLGGALLSFPWRQQAADSETLTSPTRQSGRVSGVRERTRRA
jgi:hypothetical protein